jgi:hypothetical protein
MEQAQPTQTDWDVGAHHHVHFEEPDILVATLKGWIELEHAQTFIDITRKLASRGPVYWVVHMQEMEGYPYPRLRPEARTYLADHSQSDWFKGILHVGGGILQRITIKGLTLAMMLTGSRSRFETIFPDTMEDAWAMIDAHRAKPSSSGKS